MATITTLQMPNYKHFTEAIALLNLPISASELHGVMCGYLAAGHPQQGEHYLRALMLNHPEKSIRNAAKALFSLYAVSQQQLSSLEIEFQLLLPDDDEHLYERARAFSEWCEGFTQSLTIAELNIDELKTEEAQEAISHLIDFANLDYDALVVSEEDERALTEVIEYTRIAILHIYAETLVDKSDGSKTTH